MDADSPEIPTPSEDDEPEVPSCPRNSPRPTIAKPLYGLVEGVKRGNINLRKYLIIIMSFMFNVSG